MKRLRLLLVLVACPIMYVTVADSNGRDLISNQGGTVYGKIFGPTIIERPLRQVRVVFFPYDWESKTIQIFAASSDRIGEYNYIGLPSGRYIVGVWDEIRMGLDGQLEPSLEEDESLGERGWHSLTVEDGEGHYLKLWVKNKEENIFRYLPAFFPKSSQPQGGKLRLRIGTLGTLNPSSPPIEGVDIEIAENFGLGPMVNMGTSDASGEYQRKNMSPGNYTVKLNINGYHTEFPMTIRSNQLTGYNVIFREGKWSDDLVIPEYNMERWPIEIERLTGQAADKLRASSTIHGKISNTNAQIPGVDYVHHGIPDAQVVIVSETGQEYQCTSDDSGEYEYIGLPAGRYLMNIRKKGYTDRKGIPVTIVKDKDNVFEVHVYQESVFGTYIVHEAYTNGGYLSLVHGMTEKENFSFGLQFEGGTWLIIFLSLLTLTLLIVLTVLTARIFSKRETSES